jgi:nicotinate-nucleotide adenylyltransferase
LGGTFDPVHIGHLRAAMETRKRLNLDQVCLIPAARPPHKTDRRTAISQNRLNMLKAAIKDVEGLTVSDLELHRDGPSYTLDTVNTFLTEAESGANFFLMMGLDAFLEFNTWYRYQTILKTIAIVVICRPGRWGYSHTEMKKTLRRYLKMTLPPGYTWDADEGHFRHAAFQPIHLVEIPLLEISATAIRRRIHENEPVDYLVPPSVEQYIVDRGLYR